MIFFNPPAEQTVHPICSDKLKYKFIDSRCLIYRKICRRSKKNQPNVLRFLLVIVKKLFENKTVIIYNLIAFNFKYSNLRINGAEEVGKKMASSD